MATQRVAMSCCATMIAARVRSQLRSDSLTWTGAAKLEQTDTSADPTPCLGNLDLAQRLSNAG